MALGAALGVALGAGPSAAAAPPGVEAAARPQVVHVYVREGCPRCDAAERWLADLDARREDVVVEVHDVGADPAARRRLEEVARRAGQPLPGVPAIEVGDALLVGFAGPSTTGARVERALAGEVASAEGGAVPDGGAVADDGTLPGDLGATCAIDAETCDGAVDLPLIGPVDVDRLGLPLFTVAIGLVDGFNPCATWVLLFLLSLLVHMKDRARMALVAGTFVLVGGAVYYAFMAAWLNLFLVLGLSRGVQIALGVVAVAIGAIHVKDFFALHRGVTLSIPEAAHPTIAARARRILHAEDLPGAVAGAAALAVLVNVVELLCTAGLPAVYTGVLVRHGLPPAAHYAYLALYIAAYVADDAALVAIAVVTLTRTRLQERGGRWLKLASGAVILALGLLMLLRPSWLAW